MNGLHSLLHATQNLIPGQELMSGWINGWLYEPTPEHIGIVPLPPRLLDASDMVPFSEAGTSSMKHTFLAMNQGARYAVLPVATNEEKKLYGELKQTLPSLHNGDFVAAAKLWNQKYADGINYFYKVGLFMKI